MKQENPDQGHDPVNPDYFPLNESAFARSMKRLYWPSLWFNARLNDAHNLPEGAALLAGNHGPLGLDAPLLMHMLYRQEGRAARGLLDRILVSNLMGRFIADQVGCMLGDRKVATAALQAGDIVVTYPGGVPETTRASADAYQLRWEHKYGFIHCALKAQVPVVPVACVGIDDVYFQLLEQKEMLALPWGRNVGKMVGERYVTPWYVGPLPAQLNYWIGAPIDLGYGPEDAHNPEVLERCQLRVKRALQERIEHGLAVRELEAPEQWREQLREPVRGGLGRLRSRMLGALSRVIRMPEHVEMHAPTAEEQPAPGPRQAETPVAVQADGPIAVDDAQTSAASSPQTETSRTQDEASASLASMARTRRKAPGASRSAAPAAG